MPTVYSIEYGYRERGGGEDVRESRPVSVMGHGRVALLGGRHAMTVTSCL